ncbi:Sphingomyelinase [Fusarium oxysporum f. sp. albedinis]|nr:Sphingomyelinase [Fusarium oxysporum f. sp. albedinis]
MTAKMEASEDAKPKYKRASTPKVRTGCITWIRHLKCDEGRPHCRRCLGDGVICDRYAPIEPKIPRKRRRQEKSTAEASQDCNALPSAICDMHIFPLQLLNTPFSIPISDQSIIFLKAPYPLALSLSSASRTAANPESELAPIQKQPPLRSEAKLPRIAELVQDAAMSTTSNRESIVRLTKPFCYQGRK